MAIVSVVLVSLVAAIHIYILVLEMFLWRAPRTRAGFGTTAEFADATAVLAANQGLYNGFLAGGLIWGLLAADPVGRPVTLFFLACVAIAGVYGAATSSRRIILVQTVPAVLAGAAVLLS